MECWKQATNIKVTCRSFEVARESDKQTEARWRGTLYLTKPFTYYCTLTTDFTTQGSLLTWLLIKCRHSANACDDKWPAPPAASMNNPSRCRCCFF